MISKSIDKQNFLAGSYLLCYFLVNLSILGNFPFVHSDEAWLSGLTRTMSETNHFGVTEPFYDLKPRYPHGIKILFHMMQMVVMKIFGYELYSFRLLSLFFSCLALLVFYLLLKAQLERNESDLARRNSGWINAALSYPLLGCILLSANIQFLYASHFARQEIILVFALILCLYLLYRNHYLWAGAVTGLSIGIHPNSFLIAAMCGVMLFPLHRKAINKFEGLRPFLGYTGVVTIFAGIFIGISLFFDIHFFRHYLEYGNSEFDIAAPVTNKLAELPYFLEKIWHQVSGTYYVPDIRLEMSLFFVALAGGGILLAAGEKINRREITMILKGIAGMLLGMVIIGRYNQTSIIFLFPLFFNLLTLELDWLFRRVNQHGLKRSAGKGLAFGALILLVCFSSFSSIKPWLHDSYGEYLHEISKAVSPKDKVLANLNCEYYFENGNLLDYRNLSYLKENHLSVAEYIERNQIEYIILSDEMDFIYSQRPTWNIIYGNPRYLEELRSYTDKHCSLVHQFTDNTYGIRIVQYMNQSDRDFTVQIFKVEHGS